MKVVAFFELIATLASFFLGVFIYLNNPKRPVNRFYCLLSGAIFGWNGAAFIETVTTSWQIALFFDKVQQASAICLPVFFLHFVFHLISQPPEIHRRKMIYAYGVAIVFLFLNFTQLVTWGVESKPYFNFYTVPGPFYPLFIIYFLSTMSWGVLEILAVFKKVGIATRNQAMYILLGAMIGTPAAIVNFGIVYNVAIFPFGSPLVVVYSTIIAYAVFRHRLMDIRIALTRAGIFAVVYFFVLWIPFYFGYATKSWVLTGASMLILATAGPIVYNRLRKRAEDVLLKEERVYQAALVELGDTVVQIRDDVDRLLRAVTVTISDTMQPEFAAVYVFKEKHAAYVKDAQGYGGKDLGLEMSVSHPLITALKEKHHPLTSDDPSLSNLGQEVIVVPFWVYGGLYGFMALGAKSSRSPYTSSDAAAFKALSHQVSLALENCLFTLDERRNEKLKRMRSLDAMSSSMMHEIGNPVACVIGLLTRIRMRLDDMNLAPEPRTEFVDLMERAEFAVMRISKFTKTVREFSRETSGDFELVSLDEVMENSLLLTEALVKDKAATLETDIQPGLKIQGNKIWLEEVMLNLITNALQAVERNEPMQRKVKISLRCNTPATVLISVSDNGYGIEPDSLEEIFLDFVTTKASTEGLGMGLTRARKIAERHKGRIWAESKGLNTGAAFFVELPAAR